MLSCLKRTIIHALVDYEIVGDDRTKLTRVLHCNLLSWVMTMRGMINALETFLSYKARRKHAVRRREVECMN